MAPRITLAPYLRLSASRRPGRLRVEDWGGKGDGAKARYALLAPEGAQTFS
jgi:hypothetical protein